jgi:uncharacterized protein YybS (DUF2232 family)
MSLENPLLIIKEVGGVLKLGSGLLGKSALVVGILEIVVFAAVCRVHSDFAIIGGVALGAAIFFVWFFPVIRFSGEHPAEAMLEGAEWSGYQRAQASAQGGTPSLEDRILQFAPGSSTPSLPTTESIGDNSNGE